MRHVRGTFNNAARAGSSEFAVAAHHIFQAGVCLRHFQFDELSRLMSMGWNTIIR